jgi:2'-5' RNA ligase
MKLDVDVVLLPSEEVMEKAIEYNKETNSKDIILNKETCIPHMTLCMGVVEEENLPKVNEILQEIADEFSALALTIPSIDPRGGFSIEKNEQLQELHEKIMRELEPLLTHDATTEMFFSPPPVEEKSLKWVNKYHTDNSTENFWPHITITADDTDLQLDAPIPFTASRLALCHLGNYCMCRKILWETKLR